MTTKPITFLLLSYDYVSCWKMLFVALFLILISSCATQKCPLCDTNNTTVYKIELNEDANRDIGKTKIETFFLPELINLKNDTNLNIIDCSGFDPFSVSKSRLDQLIKRNTYEIDYEMVRSITTTSDADWPPLLVNLKSEEKEILCYRYRNPMKVELRGVMGGRINNDYDQVHFPSYSGTRIDTLVDLSSSLPRLTVGIEAAVMRRIIGRGDLNAFSPGFLVGYWPVGENLYIPFSFHPRFTFNDVTSPLVGECNTTYLYADIGTAWNIKGKVPLVSNFKFTTWFMDIGVGRDIWMSPDNDFSIDIGYRYSSLSLPFKANYQSYIEKMGIEKQIEYPYKRTSQLYIRFGMTW